MDPTHATGTPPVSRLEVYCYEGIACMHGSPCDGGFRQAARGFGIIIMTCRARFFWRTCRRLILISTAEAKAKAGSVQLVSTAPFLQPSNTPRGGILPGRVTSRSGIDRFPIGAANTCFKFVLFLDRRNPTPRSDSQEFEFLAPALFSRRADRYGFP